MPLYLVNVSSAKLFSKVDDLGESDRFEAIVSILSFFGFSKLTECMNPDYIINWLLIINNSLQSFGIVTPS